MGKSVASGYRMLFVRNIVLCLISLVVLYFNRILRTEFNSVTIKLDDATNIESTYLLINIYSVLMSTVYLY